MFVRTINDKLREREQCGHNCEAIINNDLFNDD